MDCVGSYLLSKGLTSWDVEVKQVSWIVKKILKEGQWLEQRDLQVPTIMKEEKFNIKVMYTKREYNKVSWRRFTLNNLGNPQWVCTLYVSTHQRQTQQLRNY